MNAQDNPVLALVKRLAGDNWREAYEILLRHPGDSCDGGRPDPGFAAVENLILGLELKGKHETAKELRQLSCGLDDDDDVLLLLALCARNISNPGAKTGPFPVAVVSTPEPEKDKPHCISAFPLALEAKSSDVPRFLTSQPLGKAPHFLWNTAKLFPEEAEAQARASAAKPRKKIAARKKRHTKRPKPIPVQPEVARRLKIKCDDANLPEDAREVLHFLINGTSSEIKRAPRAESSDSANYDDMEMARALHRRGPLDYAVSKQLLDSCRLHRFRPGFDGILARAKVCGALYRTLIKFSVTYLNYSKRILSSVVKFCQSLTQTYLLRILEVSKTEVTCGDYCSGFVFAAEISKDDMLAVLEILRDIEASEGSACEILDIVSGALQKSHAMPVVEQLFLEALSTYVEMIWDWVFYGSSARDVGREFFGSILGAQVTDSERLLHSGVAVKKGSDSEFEEDDSLLSFVPRILSIDTALFILRAGRSRRLLEFLRPSDPLLHLDPPEIAKPFSFKQLDQVACELVSLASNHAFVSSSAQLAPAAQTSETSSGCSDLSSSPKTPVHNEPMVAKSIRIFTLPVEEPSTEDSLISNGEIFSFSDSLCLPDGKPLLCEKERTLETRQSALSYFERAVAGNMRKVDLFSQRKILDHFVHELKVFDHLRFLGNFVLLGAGDFASALVEEISVADATSSEHEKFISRRVSVAGTFYGSTGAGGSALRKRRYLKSCLSVAMNSATTDQGSFAENFSISIGNDCSHQSSLWKCFIKVGYVVDFPLNLIISPEVLNLYSKFFNFFLSIRRAELCLRTLFTSTRRRSVLQGGVNSINASVKSMRRGRMALWQFCWHAEHFVSIVGGYEFNQIHGSSLSEFQSSWEKISSIWELRDEHMRYLEDSIRRVLLGKKQTSVMHIITEALDVIFDVESRIVRGASTVDLGNEYLQEVLANATDNLKKRTTFLIDVLEKLVVDGAHPHLQDFLTRLNFNYYYKQPAF